MRLEIPAVFILSAFSRKIHNIYVSITIIYTQKECVKGLTSIKYGVRIVSMNERNIIH